MIYTLFMVLVTGIGLLGTLARGPIWGVAVYYFFAVLRPQYLWQWALPEGVAWSWYVAIVAMARAGLQLVGVGRTHVPADRARLGGFSRAHVAFGVFGIWVCLSYAFAIDRDYGAAYFGEYQKIFIMYAVGALAIRRMSHLWSLYVLATVAIGYVAYELNMRYLQQGYLDIYKRGYGGLDNNGAGLMIAMGIPLALYAWEGTKGRARWIFASFIPFMLHAVLMSYSRGAMVSLLAATPLLWLRSSLRRQFTVALVILACLVPVFAGEQIRDRFLTLSQHDQDESANSRRQSWAAAIRIASDYPIFGAGVRNANLLSFKYGADMEGRTIHSQYFQIAADNGFVGLGCYALAFGVAFLALRRGRGVAAGIEGGDAESADEAAKGRAVTSGVECSLAVYCLGSSFLSLETFELPYLLLLLAAQAGTLRMPAPVPPPARDPQHAHRAHAA